MRTAPLCLVIALCSSVLSCEGGNAGHVVLDVGALHQALLAANSNVNSVSLQVSAVDITTPLVYTVDLASLTAAFDVPAGPQRIFEITGTRTNVSPAAVTYWGRSQVDLPPDTTLNLTLPAFAAGVLTGSVQFSDASVVPSVLQLTATAQQGRAAAPASVSLLVKQGKFSQPLPTGTYRITGSVAANGNTYDVSPTVTVAVTQGAFANTSVTLSPAGPSTLMLAFIEQPAATVAGAAFALSVGVTDGVGRTHTEADANVSLTLQGPSAALQGTTQKTTQQGVARFGDLAVALAGSGYTLVATAPGFGAATSASFAVAPGDLATLAFVQFPTNTFVNTATVAVVAAQDAFGNAVPTYNGTVHFSSTPAGATVPNDYSYSAADSGVHTFSPGISFRTAGAVTVNVADTQLSTLRGSTAVTVSGLPSTVNLRVTGLVDAQAGAAQSAVVSAVSNQNVVFTTYTGTVQLTSSDANAVGLPVTYTFAAADAGVHTFSGLQLHTAAARSTVTATATGGNAVTGSQSVAITPQVTSTFVLSGLPATVPVAQSQTVVVTAADQYGNTTPAFAGTVAFSSSDLLATLPANYTFSAADAGAHAFSPVTFATPGSQSLTVTDVTAPLTTGTANVTVQ